MPVEDDQVVTALNALTGKVGDVKSKQEVMHSDLREMKVEQGRTNGRLTTLEAEGIKLGERTKVNQEWESRETNRLEGKVEASGRRTQAAIGVAAIGVAGTLGAIQYFF